jgi:hypothetical protein
MYSTDPIQALKLRGINITHKNQTFKELQDTILELQFKKYLIKQKGVEKCQQI